MSETEDKPTEEPLSFEHAEFDSANLTATSCEFCGTTLHGTYYGLNGRSICSPCLEREKAGQKGSFFKALSLGVLAGAVGAAVYYGILFATDTNFALVTILMGIGVGIAVRKGAGNSQSKVYRLMAIALTWIAMCTSFVPSVMDGFLASGGVEVDGGAAPDGQEAQAEGYPPPEAATGDGVPEEAAHAGVIIFSVLFAMLVPFFMIAELEIIGLAIFLFGLWEAFRLSAPPPFEVGGPFEASPPVTGPPV